MGERPRVAVVGAGSWGTAFACIPALNGSEVVLWARRQELADTIVSERHNPDYLEGVELPRSLTATHDIEKAVSGANVVVVAVPSHAFRSVFADVAPHLGRDAPVVSLTKGIEQDSLMRMSELVREVGDLPEDRVAVVSGPNLAREISKRQPSASVVACVDERRAEALQDAFMAPYFRVYVNPDVVGVELGGAFKNVIALAAGMGDGMGFGDNSKATLITRGLAELARLGKQMGGNPLTFAGLAGMGDLIATCTSPLSRNRYVGEELGKGRSLEEIVAETKMVAEGIKTSRAVVRLAEKLDVDVPIAEHVCRVIYDGMSPQDMVRSLMEREARPELEGIDDDA
jgi:glycerol-3-phosphate dehydrogenase (NAD(P)+)